MKKSHRATVGKQNIIILEDVTIVIAFTCHRHVIRSWKLAKIIP